MRPRTICRPFCAQRRVFRERYAADSARCAAHSWDPDLTGTELIAFQNKSHGRSQQGRRSPASVETARKILDTELPDSEKTIADFARDNGLLDDEFRKFLRERPAGQLENDPELKRWMPTVKQRVEQLQKQAARVQKEKKVPYAEAAEILLLRKVADVRRGGAMAENYNKQPEADKVKEQVGQQLGK